jgi:quercetin dioxygenase-like cupin family protein
MIYGEHGPVTGIGAPTRRPETARGAVTDLGGNVADAGPDDGGFLPDAVRLEPGAAYDADPAALLIANLRVMAADVAEHGLPVHGAPAVGLPLVTNGKLGADILHVPAHGKFPVHCHPGDHLLLCLEGEGTISIGERTYEVHPGDLYLVPGAVPHAVGAGSADHILVAIGSPHKPVDSPERMWFTNWVGDRVGEPLFA